MHDRIAAKTLAELDLLNARAIIDIARPRHPVCPVEKYCSKVKVTAEDGEYCPRIEGNIAPEPSTEPEEYCPANILKAGIVY